MVVQKIIHKAKHDNERGAREAILEDLFYDFHRARVKVYKMNFVRGVFFGFGSVLGGTLVVAIVIWMLGMAALIFPPVGNFFDGITEAIKQRPQ